MAANLDDESTRAFQEEAEAFLRFSGGIPPNPNDIFLAVMGTTGSGKSSFVARCSNSNVQIGHGLQSCTSDVSIRSFNYASRRIHLIDTPGWDDTNRSDVDTLTAITQCLCTSYANGIKLSGIIYLQRISDNRVGGSAKRNFEMFKTLCGPSTYASIFLITTMWNISGSSQQLQEEQREQELASTFWEEVILAGGTMRRHTTDSRGSALRILDEVLNSSHRQDKNIVLDIQREMVDQKLPLINTTAGRLINKDLTSLRDQLEAELSQTRLEIRLAQEKHDEETALYLKTMERDFQLKLQTSSTENQELRLSLEEVYRKMEDKVSKALEQMNKETKAAIEAKEEELEVMQNSAMQITEEIQKAQKEAERRRDVKESRKKEREMREMRQEYEEMLKEMKSEIAALKRNKEKKESTGKEVLVSLAKGTASGLASTVATSVLTAAAGGAALAFCIVS